AQEGRGHALAAARPLEEQRALRVPAPPGLEDRRREHGLDQHVAGRGRIEVVEDLLEREAVLRPEREDDRLLVGRRLQLEAEADAELLAERQAPSAVDSRAERRMDDELHAAALVEEPFEDDAALRRDRAQRRTPGGDVLRDLLGGAARQSRAALRLEERGRV